MVRCQQLDIVVNPDRHNCRSAVLLAKHQGHPFLSHGYSFLIRKITLVQIYDIFFLCTWISRSMTCVFLDPCFMVQGCLNPGYLFLWTFYNLQSCSSTYWYNSSKVLPRFHNRYFFYRCTGAKFEKKTGKWDFSDFDDGDRGNGPASKWHSHHQLYPSTHPLFRAPKIIVIILYLYLYFS